MSTDKFSPEAEKSLKDKARAYARAQQVASRRARLAYFEEKERKAKESES